MPVNVRVNSYVPRWLCLCLRHALIFFIPESHNLVLTLKVIPQQAEVAQEVQGRLRPRVFLTFGTTRVIGRQAYAPTAFTPGEIPGTHFQMLNRPQHGSVGGSHGTVRLVAQCVNHYATPGPIL